MQWEFQCGNPKKRFAKKGCRHMTKRRFALLLALFSACHTFLWIYLVPPGQGADEETHFAIVEHLAHFHTGPDAGKDFWLSLNWDSAIEAAGYSEIRLQTFRRPHYVEWTDQYPEKARMSGPTYMSGSSGAPWLYHLLGAFVYGVSSSASVFHRMYAVRLLGILFAVGLSHFSWRLFTTLEGDGEFSRGAAMCVAAQPMAHFLCGYVTPDGATLCLTAAFLYACWALSKRSAQPRDFIGLGIFCGAAFWVKPLIISFVPIALFVVLTNKISCNRRFGVALFLLTVGAPLAVWSSFSWIRYGGPTNLWMYKPDPSATLLGTTWKYAVGLSPGALFSQGLGVFGWLDAPLAKPVRLIAAIVFILGWSSVIVLALRGRISRPWLALMAVPFVHFAVVMAGVIWTSKNTGYFNWVPGRYFLYPLAGWMGPALLGWHRVLAEKIPVVRLCAAGSFFLAAYSLFWIVLERYYL